MINVPETDIRTLIKVYKVQFVSKLVKEYLLCYTLSKTS
jgi:hypothetical protein